MSRMYRRLPANRPIILVRMSRVIALISILLAITSWGQADVWARNYGNWCGTPRYGAQTAIDSLSMFAVPLLVAYVVNGIKDREAVGYRCALLVGVATWGFCLVFVHRA